MGVEMGYKTVPKSRDHLQSLIPQSIQELAPRTMRDSYTVGIIPLSSDPVLQEKYVSLTGTVRLSRFLEDMDLFAVIAARKFLLDPRLKPGMPCPYTIVTALVDRIEFSGYAPKLTSDVRISGHVSWVGRSSMEVVVWLDQKPHGEWNRITKAVFLLAARDAINSKSAVVNPLKPETDEEKAICKGGQERKVHRIKLKDKELTKTIPSFEEQKVIHDLFMRTMNISDISLQKHELPAGCVWMEDCTISNIIHAHPENRNHHYTVFGGFLMQQAAELSNTLGLLFSNHRPVLTNISDINFTKPVKMSSLLKMHAHVVFTQMHYLQITVYAETWDVLSKQTTTTNSFHFTYEVPEMLPEVFPKTYNEAMMYIDGRRHFYDVMHSDSRDVLTFEPITYFESPDSKL
ncbi:hypothetical protein AMK59_4083 [Oryctes borbonicus]|uniref:HotDog ACOT-type domain-containing protein n=1 Tax=Oryctes borbonicus TaxID=1629725 RepID=A0A0T6B5X9_9SCAR|nr:hypothetical protein AMK59_4083 [Oryctes borbonicus]